jgi:hypothetical protein
MPVLVGTLAVDITTNQATFTLDKAKSELDDFGRKGKEAGEKVEYSMREARESIMLTGEALGVHLPAGITRVIASIGPLGAALEAAMPAAAIIAGVALIIEHYNKMAEAQRKAADEAANASVKFIDEGRSLQVTGLKLDDQIAKLEHRPSQNKLKEAILESANALDKLAQAFASEDQKMDEGLNKELGLMSKMVDYIESMAKGFATGGDIGVGIAASLTAAWHDAEKAVLKASEGVTEARLKLSEAPPGDNKAQVQGLVDALQAQKKAESELTALTVSGTKERTESLASELRTQAEINQLRQQVSNNSKSEKVAKLEDKDAGLEPLREQAQLERIAAQESTEHAKALRQIADLQSQAAKSAKEEKAAGGSHDQQPQAQLTAKLQAINEQKTAAIEAANDELTAKKRVYDADIAAAGNNNVRKRELDAQYKSEVQKTADAIAIANAQADAKSAAAHAQYVQELKALAHEQQTIDEQNAQHAIKMAQLQEQGEEAVTKARLKMKQTTDEQAEAAEKEFENNNYRIQQEALQRELSLLDKSAADYNARVNAIHNRQEEMEREHQNKLSQIEINAEEDRNKRIMQAETRLVDSISQDLAKTIVTGKNFAQEMKNLGAEVLEGMIAHTIQMIAMGNMQRFNDARTAAAHTYSSVSAIPIVGPFLAPEAAAAAFAAVMAFAQGGIVPGYGPGDTVPAALTPGEMVLPKPISQGLQGAIQNGTLGGGDHFHGGNIHINASAMDADGIDKVLKKHASKIHKHAMNEMRRRNKR